MNWLCEHLDMAFKSATMHDKEVLRAVVSVRPGLRSDLALRRCHYCIKGDSDDTGRGQMQHRAGFEASAVSCEENVSPVPQNTLRDQTPYDHTRAQYLALVARITLLGTLGGYQTRASLPWEIVHFTLVPVCKCHSHFLAACASCLCVPELCIVPELDEPAGLLQSACLQPLLGKDAVACCILGVPLVLSSTVTLVICQGI